LVPSRISEFLVVGGLLPTAKFLAAGCLAGNRHWRLQGEGEARFHGQRHVPFSSERGAYCASRGSRARANQGTGSTAGYCTYRGASTGPAADPQPVAFLMALAHASGPVGVDIIRNASQGEGV
jgi:hypothetical protein